MSNKNIKKINIKIIINNCLYLAILAALIYTLGIYIKVYYDDINIKTINNHLVVCINIILKLLSKFSNNLLDSLLTEGNMKIIIIALAVIYSIDKFKLKDWINGITDLEMNGFKLSKKVQALDDMNKTEQNNIKELEKKQDKEDDGEDFKEKIKLSKIRLDLLKTMIDEPYIVTVLERFVDKKIGALKIPMNVFKQNTSIAKIFEYDMSVGFVKIKEIKPEIKDIIYDIYIRIKNENKG